MKPVFAAMTCRAASARRRATTAILVGSLVGSLLASVFGTAAGQVIHRNLGELTSLSPDIVVGVVVAIGDGVSANNLPFTEVTLAISQTVKGKLSGTVTFRQFGLQKPRAAANGLTNVMLTPAGWPRYAVGEEVMLFLYHPGRVSGLRTTVGLNQGKFTIRNGHIANAAGNAGLLDRVSLPADRAGRSRAVVGATNVADADTFIDLVDTAVREKWFEAAR